MTRENISAHLDSVPSSVPSGRVNSRAVEVAGVTEESAEPPGGRFDRAPTDRRNGYVDAPMIRSDLCATERACPSVLVVDDDPNILAVSRRALGCAGFDVTVAASATQAVLSLQGRRIDVAILDYFLGTDTCGCDLIAPFRAHNASIRIVVLSGLGDFPELIRHAHACGADVVESKTRVDWIRLVRGDTGAPQPARPAVDLAALKREAIHGTFLVHRRNVSSTARALRMKRGNLQRLLRKTPPPGPNREKE